MNKIFVKKKHQSGVAPLLLLVVVGLMLFFVVSFMGPFQSGLLSQLFEKQESSAATDLSGSPVPVVYVDPSVVAEPTVTVRPTASPTAIPTIAPTKKPSARLTPAPTSGIKTVTFNDKSGQNTVLSGQYPEGVINWGSDVWKLTPPWQKLTSKSISLNGKALKSGSFSFVIAKTLVSLDLYNGGNTASTITLACDGNENRMITAGAKQLMAKVATGWLVPCSAVTVLSSNGSDTNFDNLVIK